MTGHRSKVHCSYCTSVCGFPEIDKGPIKPSKPYLSWYDRATSIHLMADPFTEAQGFFLSYFLSIFMFSILYLSLYQQDC